MTSAITVKGSNALYIPCSCLNTICSWRWNRYSVQVCLSAKAEKGVCPFVIRELVNGKGKK